MMDQVDETPSTSATVADTVRIYVVVLCVGVCCAVAIVTTYQWTLPIINEMRIAQRSAAVADVLPEATLIVPQRYDADAGRFEIVQSDAQGADVVFVGFDFEHQSIGVVIETRGMGYQDYIRLLYAYSFEQQAITGIRVLESRETPGLGDRIETDKEFLNNFVRLEVQIGEQEQQILNPIEFVKPGEKVAAWQIDGITGATISSRAIADMLRDSTNRWIPFVLAHRNEFNVAKDSD